MNNISFDEMESRYIELLELSNSKKNSVYLVRSQLDDGIYIKKELKNYNLDVYNQIIKIENIYMAKIYEMFKCDDSLIVIEEFINGKTLQRILDDNGSLDEDIAIGYIINLCSILDILHNQTPPVIHRDIKPSNIIIDNSGVLKLIDFDVSRVYKEESNMDTHILGTKGYASPEQFGFEQTDCRSDIYSVGVLINVLTTGKHIKEKLNEGKLKDIIEKCTSLSPDSRYSFVKELQMDLSKILSEKEKNENIKLNLKKDNGIEKKGTKTLNDKKGTKIKYKKNKFFSIIGEIPGYRKKNIISIIIATLWYSFLIFGLTANFEKGNIKLILEDIFFVSLLMLMTLLNCNFKGIIGVLPITRSSKIYNKIGGLILYNILLFAIYGVILDIFNII
ncbi:serine/threonine-protein kinase [Clostridium sp.]|uniref:serine/threonine protein kinase n=1 Tax=Clostridium sp. TaxID=1506 RepID=UPI0025B9BA77|nr:serine/threonine-protein kinase [Clostridium sp.]MCI9303515.1 serine/threonine protein kinase [Clostridium sp.]